MGTNYVQKPHVVIVPFMGQGHMIPMFDIARLLADRGAHITFIATPVNASRIKPLLDSTKSENQLIDIVEFTFPCKEFGLPEGCENADLISSNDHFQLFFHAANALGPQLRHYIQNTSPKVVCIIADFFNYFTAEVGESLNIPRIIFHVSSCLFLHSTQSMYKHNSYDGKGEFDVIIVPDLPKKIEATKAQAPGLFGLKGWERFREKAEAAEALASGIVVNTYYELESEVVDRYEKLMGKKVWPFGPLCLYDKDVDSKAIRGMKSSIDATRVLKWLDSREAESVIYVSLGSLVRTKTQQLIEIGIGLEKSNVPFVWVVKEVERTSEFDKWMSGGFEERTKDRGLVITGWAPQVVILSHSAIGGFMTHCGWNSMLEAISAGVPMLTWPHFGDQFMNEKLVVEIVETGVSAGVQKPFHYYTEEKVAIKSEAVGKAVLRLMDKGKEGNDRRRRAKQYGEKAQKAMEEEGSSWKSMALFMESITQAVKPE